MRSSPAAERRVLIVGLSGRVLAAAAVAARWQPRVVDAFADRDTQAMSAACRRVPVDAGLRLRRRALLDTVADVQRTHGPMPVICAAGFEACPQVLDALAANGVLLGCNGATMARLRDVPAVFTRLAEAGVNVPDTRSTLPADAAGWLAKRRGASGGAHVRVAGACLRRGEYAQRRVEGPVRSALYVSDGQGLAYCGSAVQLSWHPAPGSPYRYEGACTATAPAGILRAAVDGMAEVVARQAGLVGGFGLDFVVPSDDAPVLLDVNPRLPATLDLLDDAGAVFEAHVQACTTGTLLYSKPRRSGAAGHLVIYSDRGWTVPQGFPWPALTADVPAEGTTLAAGMPICTLRARAASPAVVLRALLEKYRALRAATDTVTPGVLPDIVSISRVGEQS